MYIKVCLQCNKEYETAKETQKFCCRECYGNWKSNHMQGEDNPQYNPDKLMIACSYCGKLFHPRHKEQKYCSIKCVGKSHTGENSPVINKNLKTKLCPVCKTEFRQKREKQECCCFKCKQLYHSEKVLGKKNPAYKNGVGFGNYCEKFNRDFKKRVKLFYNNTCVVCGNTKGVVVHHVNENLDACCNKDPLLNNLNTFVVLCKSCHFRYHVNKKFENIDIVQKINSIINNVINQNNGKTYYTKEEYYEIMSKIRK